MRTKTLLIIAIFSAIFSFQIKQFKAECSPNLTSAATSCNGFQIPPCKIGSGEDANGVFNNLLSAYPNPADRSFKRSLQQLPTELSEIATVNLLDQVGQLVSSS